METARTDKQLRATPKWKASGLLPVQTANADEPPKSAGTADSPFVPSGYRLVWSDEFDGPQLDTSKWSPRGSGRRRGGIVDREAVHVDAQGHLVIETLRLGDEYHSGMISTQRSFQTTYGYFEVRLRLPTQGGQNSGFWLQSPKNVDDAVDPAVSGAEIDVLEFYRGRLGGRADNALHWGGYGEHHERRLNRFSYQSGPTDWHVFALLWTPTEYRFFADGKQTWQTSDGLSHVPEYMILSTVIGNRTDALAQAHLPDQFMIDYVRVYKSADGIDDAKTR